jgi:uncharacterized membrane-anchored protein YhcB (DUF1043 family)
MFAERRDGLSTSRNAVARSIAGVRKRTGTLGADTRGNGPASTIAVATGLDEHRRVSTPGSHDDTSPSQAGDAAAQSGGPGRDEPKKRRNAWVWISALLAVLAAGLLVWALSVKSDQDSTQQELTRTQEELDSTQQKLDSAEQDAAQQQATQEEEGSGAGDTVLAVGALATIKSLYDDLAEQLDATQQDLAATEQDLQAANDKAEKADQDAAAAKKKASEADNETDKAKAEAEKANAEADAANAKTEVAAACAKAYVSALGTILEGDDVRAQAEKVGEQLKGITADCKAALADT